MNPSNYFLNHSYRKYGWIIIGLHTAIVLFLILATESLNLLPITNVGAVIVTLFPYSLMAGFALLVFTEEKNEDEMFRFHRIRSFQFGIIFAIAASLLVYIINYMIRPTVVIEGLYLYPTNILLELDSLPAILIYIWAIYQYKLLKLRSDEESD